MESTWDIRSSDKKSPDKNHTGRSVRYDPQLSPQLL
jgi:hypothetical protein